MKKDKLSFWSLPSDKQRKSSDEKGKEGRADIYRNFFGGHPDSDSPHTPAPFCVSENRSSNRFSVLPKVTKSLQRKSFFFVQQVQSFPFQKVMAAPGWRKFSPGAQEALST